MLVYVEPHDTVPTSVGYKYVFGAGTRLQVLTSEYYRQDGLYFISCWCSRAKEREILVITYGSKMAASLKWQFWVPVL